MLRNIVLVFVFAFISSEIGNVFAANIQPLPFKKVSVRSLVEDANALLDELEQKSSAALEEANGLLKEYGTRLESINNQVTTSGQDLINNLAKQAVSDLDAIEATASKVSADISLCTSLREEQIRGLGASTLKDLDECLSRRLTNANNDLDDSAVAIQNTYRRVNEARKALGKCASDDDQCLNDAIELIKNEIIQVPGWIKQITQQAAQSVEHSSSLLGDCVTSSQYVIEDISSDLLEEIKGCSKDIVAFFTKYIIANRVVLRDA